MSRFANKVALVNGGGTGIGRAVAEALVELDDDALEQTLGVNVRGVLITTREAIPYLSKSGGAVVNISSTLAQASMPGAAAYSGAKAAVERLTSALAVELGPHGIRLNSVAPGLTETDMSAGIPQEMLDGMIAQTPLGRLGRPEDIAKAVA